VTTHSLGEMMIRGVATLIGAKLTAADSPAHAHVAQVAREHAEAVAKKRGGVITKRFVDGIEGAPEERVRFNGGSIVYEFTRQSGIARFMLARAIELSPVRTGAFAAAWFIVVNGAPWTRNLDDIPSGSTIMLTNYAPYARRLEMGHEVHLVAKNSRAGRKVRTSGKGFIKAHAQYLVAERVRQATLRQFPGLDVERAFVSIPGAGTGSASGWPVPWVIQRGRDAGQSVLYPAVIVSGA
jgi:hypothetical protein